MELGHALSQISEIHGHLDRAEVYRGYRPAPLAASGLLAFVAGTLEPILVPAADIHFVAYWLAVAALSGIICGSEIALNWLRDGAVSRRKTLRVLGQFAPCVVAGCVLTAAVTLRWEESIAILPGLWALLFGLGVFASRPYLPRTIGWVALYYVVAGFALLWFRGNELALWGMGPVFGSGQLAAAWVFHKNLERDDV